MHRKTIRLHLQRVDGGKGGRQAEETTTPRLEERFIQANSVEHNTRISCSTVTVTLGDLRATE